MSVEGAKIEVNEASIIYQARTKLSTLATSIAGARKIQSPETEKLILQSSKIKLFLKALDYNEFLTREQRERIWYALIEVSEIYDFPTAPLLEPSSRPDILLGYSVTNEVTGLTELTNGHIFVGDATDTPVPRLMSGDVSISNTGVAAIGTGVIVNADINASAAIAVSKLAALTASKVVKTNGSGVLSTVDTDVTPTNGSSNLVDSNGVYDFVTATVVGLWDDRGNFNASVNAYPSSGGSGTAGAILKGDIWTVSVGGTLPTGLVVVAGDTVRALVDTPGNTQANWAIAENNIGYVAENSANKENATIDTSTTKYPTVNLLKTGLDTKQPLDATLTALAGLSTGANKVPYSTGTDTFGQLDFKDEDDMSSASDTAVPSQQSTKAYNDQVRFNRQTASYTLVLGDVGKMVEMNVAGANNLTIPLNATVAFPIGSQILVSQYGAGQTTIVATGGVTIRSQSGYLDIATQYSCVTLIKVGTNEWYLFGALTA